MKKLGLVKTKTIIDHKISDATLKDLIANKTQQPKFADQSKENERNFQNINRKSGLIVAIKDDKLITGIPIAIGGSMIFLPIPDLVTFYFNSAISLYNQSEELLSNMKNDKNLKVGDLEMANITDGIYYHFLMLRITIFSYLAIIIEFLVNRNLPETIEDKGKDVPKFYIEQNFTLIDKIKILNSIGKCSLKHNDIIFQRIIRTYQLRSELFHPKTSNSKFDNEEALKVYPEVIADARLHIEAVTQLIINIEPETLEWV